MTTLELPLELLSLIAEFLPQVKSFMFCCRDFHNVIVALDKESNGGFLDSRINPIMTLWAYFPDRFELESLMRNRRISKELYVELQEKTGINWEYQNNPTHYMDFIDKQTKFEPSYDITSIKNITLDFILEHFPKHNDIDLIYEKLITVDNSHDCTIEANLDIISKLTIEYLRDSSFSKESISQATRNPEFSLETILDNLDLFDVNEISSNTGITMEEFLKYEYSDLIKWDFYSLSWCKDIARNMTKELLLKYEWYYELLIGDLPYQLMLDTPEIDWEETEYASELKMPFSVYKEMPTVDIHNYSCNPGLTWRDVVKFPYLPWNFRGIALNDAFN